MSNKKNTGPNIKTEKETVAVMIQLEPHKHGLIFVALARKNFAFKHMLKKFTIFQI